MFLRQFRLSELKSVSFDRWARPASVMFLLPFR